VVIPRKGVTQDPKVNWYLKPPHIYLQNDEQNSLMDVSSTWVKESLRKYGGNGFDPAIQISREVYNYIDNKKLYALGTGEEQ
jgi:nicotinic acid mononucleotide adenylyltransferase